MRYGIRAGALLVDGEQVLLVHHKDAKQTDFWVPPGGRLQGSESIFECAKRETLEETGLVAELDRILYIQELWGPGYHFCRFFILGRALDGNLTLANKEQCESYLVDARFFSQDDLQDVAVQPEILKEQFWDDLRSGFTGTRYLGLERLHY